MSVFKIILLAWFALGAVLTVSVVGKPRKPITAGQAAIQLLFTGIISTLVVLA
jgi:hypothetical protein